MKTTILVLAATLFQGLVMAQAPIIFQPGPGLNDGTDQGGLNGGKDVFANEYEYTTNYGNSAVIIAVPPSNCNNTQIDGYIQFDLSSLPNAVDSVFANFYHYPQTNYCYSNCDSWFFFAPITTEWNEMDVTFGNRPTYTTAFYDSIHFVFPDTGGWHRYNITTQYNNWKTGNMPNYGMAIYSTTVGCNNAAILFDVSSSDDTTAGNTQRPYLEIYETPSAVQNTVKAKLNAKVYPNPAQDNLTLTYDLFEPMPVGLRVEGLDGRLWFLQASIELEEGNHTTPINIAKLAAGIYMLVVETPIGTLREKILVQ